ncbi:MAG: hypothetical protein KC912_03220 [Proteobacteria bacterium]|nr:hypothetical protein [Pseudomonadota bacterium]
MLRLAPLVLLLACAGGDDATTDSGTPTGGLTAPEITTSPDGTARSDADIEAVIVTESTGASDIAYSYDWQSGTVIWAEALLPATATTKGETWTLTVIPSADGATGPGAAVEVTIGNTPPVLQQVSFGSAPVQGESLLCIPGTTSDYDEDAVTVSFAWAVNGTPATETSDTLAGTAFVTGDSITCTVTPNDGEDDGEPVSVTADGQNQPPTLASVTLTPTDATSSDALTCTGVDAADPDGDSVTLAYAWTVNGTVLTSETSDTLATSNFARGNTVRCAVTPNDGTFDGTSVTSNELTIANSPPALSAAITPTNALSIDDLTCTGTVSDADGDTPTLSYAWTRDTNAVAHTTSVLPASLVVRDSTYACTITADDGFDTVDASAQVFVFNTPPTLTGAEIQPASATTTTELSCAPIGYDDPDGDGAQYTYAWTINGNAAGTSATLAASAHASGDTITCAITPGDGQSLGQAQTSSALTIANTPPTLSNVRLSSTTPAAQADDLICSAGTLSDPDANDTLNTTVTWYVDGAEYTGTTSSTSLSGDTILADDLRSCHSYACEIAVHDGTVGVSDSAAAAARAEAHPMCGGGSACMAGSAADGPYRAYDACIYLGDDGASCDQTCLSSGLAGPKANVSPTMEDRYADSCTTAANNAVGPAAWFYEHGNEGGWSQYGTSTTGNNSIGHGLRGGHVKGACVGSGSAIGMWPGSRNSTSNRSLVCACGDEAEETIGTGASQINWVPRIFSQVLTPDRDMILKQIGMNMGTTALGCTFDTFVWESASGSTDGPWTLLESTQGAGALSVGPQMIYQPVYNVNMKQGSAYALGFGSSCTGTLRYTSGDGTWSAGSVSYCMTNYSGFSSARAPTSNECSTGLHFQTPVRWAAPN